MLEWSIIDRQDKSVLLPCLFTYSVIGLFAFSKDLDIPFQPDIKVEADSVNEDLSEESEMNMTM